MGYWHGITTEWGIGMGSQQNGVLAWDHDRMGYWYGITTEWGIGMGSRQNGVLAWDHDRMGYWYGIMTEWEYCTHFLQKRIVKNGSKDQILIS